MTSPLLVFRFLRQREQFLALVYDQNSREWKAVADRCHELAQRRWIRLQPSLNGSLINDTAYELTEYARQVS